MSAAPGEILRALLRFDTTNPPGNERECAVWARDLLAGAGVEARLYALDENRPNLVARLKGGGKAPPLLLYGHLDVVTTAGQDWTHPPFAGELADGFIWGRGALDMKGGVAMMLAAVMRAAADPSRLPGDVVIALLADEEDGGRFGARFLVERHPEVFEGVRFALGELGGFTVHLGGRRIYPVMVAEKQACWIRCTVRGPGGHGSLRHSGGAMARLSRLLATLDRRRLPVHVTEPARLQVEALAKALGGGRGWMVKRLLVPALTDRVLGLMGEAGRTLDPILHNTVSATIVAGGEKLNVIPSQVSVDLDGRVLPGLSEQDLVAELRALLGPEVVVEVVGFIPGPPGIDMGLFGLLAGILGDLDPGSAAIPMVLPGVTDAASISRLGIQTYGFLPMRLPPGLDFASTIHAADERIPVEAVEFGAEAIHRALTGDR